MRNITRSRKMQKEMEKDDLIRLKNRAKRILVVCGNYALTNFLTLRDEINMDGDHVLNALTSFPGIALGGETCGAFTGSLMALGLE
jgi:hypothetical protein